MKTYFLIFCAVLFSISVSGQEERNNFPQLPNSFLNVEIGAGVNYGSLLGIKTVVGYRNSGLLIGFSPVGYEIGGQISYNWLYLNLGYGTIGSVQYSNPSETDYIQGVSLFTGAMINIGKPKKVFVDLNIGFGFGNYYNKATQQSDSQGGIIWSFGIGYRFGNIKSKEQKAVN